VKWPGASASHARPERNSEHRLDVVQRFWREAFDRLEKLLNELKRKENNHDSKE
jgi:hypothetical protein